MPAFGETSVPVESLILDPNNYRFQDASGFVQADEGRLHEDAVQKRTLSRHKDEEGFKELKESILKNGFLPVERIIVRPLDAEDTELYLVVEGNRRVAALKAINEEHVEGGVNIPQRVKDTLEHVPILIVADMEDDPAFIASLMGIRHVSGIKQWGGYQRAKLVADLMDTYNLSPSDVASRLGMSAVEVNRRYRAFHALQQMADDEQFGGSATPSLYAMFHEAVSVPVVRDWLGWDSEENVFTEDESLEQFYQLISGEGLPDGSPKLRSYEQVRQLKQILPNAEARALLLDPEKPFDDASYAGKREAMTQAWAAEVSEGLSALENLPLHVVKRLSDEEKVLLAKVRDAAAEILESNIRLAAGA